MKYNWEDFPQIWVVDFEFLAPPGSPQAPVCYVAREIHTGKMIKKWLNDDKLPEYSVDSDALFIAYFASAEMGCHIALNWPRPRNIIDLFVEFRVATNGKYLPAGRSLLGASTYYGLSGGDATLKDTMRERILQGPPYNEEEKTKILEYCALDVLLTTQLFITMKEGIDLQRALLRGRYMWAVAIMEYNGVPIDLEALTLLRSSWNAIKTKLIDKVDLNYHVYEEGVFKGKKFLDFLVENKISWELTATGLPRLDDDFFKDQAKSFPILKPLQELRYALGQLKLNDLRVGSDGRNRALLSPFGTITGRNTPSSSKFIFGNAVWLRNLIRPTEGIAIAYIDYSQQELAIAAALSGDENLKEAYLTGDVYLHFAKQAKAIPENATKQTHPDIREQFKTCMLGINYGMREESFARRSGLPLPQAKEIYRMHKSIYRQYWNWIESFMDTGQLLGEVTTCYGWRMSTQSMKPRALQNWPMQSHGAEILRLAICLCLENGIKVIAPVHDALLIEAPAGTIERDVEKAQWLMTEASRYVINFPIRTEAKIIRHPDHYTDPRGDLMWKSVWEAIHNG